MNQIEPIEISCRRRQLEGEAVSLVVTVAILALLAFFTSFPPTNNEQLVYDSVVILLGGLFLYDLHTLIRMSRRAILQQGELITYGIVGGTHRIALDAIIEVKRVHVRHGNFRQSSLYALKFSDTFGNYLYFHLNFTPKRQRDAITPYIYDVLLRTDAINDPKVAKTWTDWLNP